MNDVLMMMSVKKEGLILILNDLQQYATELNLNCLAYVFTAFVPQLKADMKFLPLFSNVPTPSSSE